MSHEKKNPPTGYFIFEDLIKDNCYYVDKTGFIIDLVNYPPPVEARASRFNDRRVMLAE